MKPAKQPYDVIFDTAIATIGLRFQGAQLSNVDYLNKQHVSRASTAPIAISRQAQAVKNRIEKYLDANSKVKTIKVALQLNVTPFQEKVLVQLLLIPYGETRTYGDIAKKLKTSPRAVGNACRNNPVPIIIPCHRVVSAKGIGGYSGETSGGLMTIKRKLLANEGVFY